MNCPKCEIEMTEAARHGATIDHCPACGGIWLDKGELGKIISHMREPETSLDEEFRPAKTRREEDYDSTYREKDHYDHYRDKRKSRFGKLFDIFD